jgi:hypothetical protein
MAWVRLDENFAEHPKMQAAGPLGRDLQVSALCYCNRNLTDGYIPRAAARRLADTDDLPGITAQDVIQRLIDVGAWFEVTGGYRIHDYTDYQPTREQVEAERAQKRDAGRLGGLAAAKARRKKQAPAKAGAKASAKAGALAESKRPVQQNPSEPGSRIQANPVAESKPDPVPVVKTNPRARAREEAAPPVDNSAPGGTATPEAPTQATATAVLDSPQQHAVDHNASGSNPKAAAPDAPPDGAPPKRRSQHVLDRVAGDSPPHIGAPLRAGLNGTHERLVTQALDAGWTIDALIGRLNGGWSGVQDPVSTLLYRLRRIGPAPPPDRPRDFDPDRDVASLEAVADTETAAPWRTRIRNQLTEEPEP